LTNACGDLAHKAKQTKHGFQIHESEAKTTSNFAMEGSKPNHCSKCIQL
jgi:hypothetical protein